MMPEVLRWFVEHSVSSPPGDPDYRPSERTTSVSESLRRRPGLWAEISTHTSDGGARVAASRWRRRWMGLEDGKKFKALVTMLHPNTDRPWALLLAYRPPMEDEHDI